MKTVSMGWVGGFKEDQLGLTGKGDNTQRKWRPGIGFVKGSQPFSNNEMVVEAES